MQTATGTWPSATSRTAKSRAGLAVVTGAAQGIGQETARMFARMGYATVLVDVQASGADTAQEIRAEGGSAHFLECDLTDPAAVEALADTVNSTIGKVDILINNAGWTPNQPFVEQDIELLHRIVGVNYLAVLYVCHAFLPRMNDGASIVNVSSDAARIGVGREATYAGAKAGVIAFSKSLALELAPRRIRVNVVSPGTTMTPLVHQALTDAQVERRERANPLGRLGRADEVAQVIGAIAIDFSYVNAQVLSVNGGATRVG